MIKCSLKRFLVAFLWNYFVHVNWTWCSIFGYVSFDQKRIFQQFLSEVTKTENCCIGIKFACSMIWNYFYPCIKYQMQKREEKDENKKLPNISHLCLELIIFCFADVPSFFQTFIFFSFQNILLFFIIWTQTSSSFYELNFFFFVASFLCL